MLLPRKKPTSEERIYYIYAESIESRYRKSFVTKKKVVSIVTIVSVFAVFLFLHSASQKPTVAEESTPKTQAVAGVETTATPSASAKDLPTVVESVVGKDKDNYGIVIQNLQTGETYTLNEHKQFETASLYKLWIMAETYHQIDENKLTMDQMLSENLSLLNRMFGLSSSPTATGQPDQQLSLSISDALEEMITVSDNNAALLLSEKIHLSNVATYLRANGFKESVVGSSSLPVSTPHDIDLFFEKLYRGELAGQDTTNAMLLLLRRQQINTKLTKYLPKNTIIAHKTGELDTYSHDAGIVYATSGEYIIVAMSNTKDPQTAADKIAKLSQAVFTYFTNK